VHKDGMIVSITPDPIRGRHSVTLCAQGDPNHGTDTGQDGREGGKVLKITTDADRLSGFGADVFDGPGAKTSSGLFKELNRKMVGRKFVMDGKHRFGITEEQCHVIMVVVIVVIQHFPFDEDAVILGFGNYPCGGILEKLVSQTPHPI
jgi:hypothetical protein